jgi:hypothetical protein
VADGATRSLIGFATRDALAKAASIASERRSGPNRRFASKGERTPGGVHRAPPLWHDGYPFLNFFQQRMQQNAIFIWVIRQ